MPSDLAGRGRRMPSDLAGPGRRISFDAAGPGRETRLVTDDARSLHLYSDLAEWWSTFSPPADYEHEAAFAGDLLASAARPVREVLELGSGGGNNASFLKARFEMTLVDLSPDMVAVCRRLNPECEHAVGDMCTVRLGRQFDAVFVHDAVMYLTTEAALRAAMETAYVHCRPGGVAVFAPDCTTESFHPLTEHDGHDEPDGRAIRYLEWEWDPDPTDTEVLSEFVYLIREPGKDVRVVHETHRWGLFPRATWISLLGEVGFVAHGVVDDDADTPRTYELFVAHRPPA
jgi:SAM-dependent methyltransferase